MSATVHQLPTTAQCLHGEACLHCALDRVQTAPATPPPAHEPDELLLSPKDVAARMGPNVGKDWVNQRIQSGELPSIKAGRYRLVRLGAFREFIARLEQESSR